ncbi:hypothetical protein CYMTET_10768 [Cymbomonas tetramitiformis]|uniref:Uncharacterized protein n=1 Tax=Cymbomonas tetramitiformis TaxID=36881 RepID=A0AAE0GNU4_9CHLO|nr:hypothetical protein CYMTET_10768 [Cymbomonas tetramitiformis]
MRESVRVPVRVQVPVPVRVVHAGGGKDHTDIGGELGTEAFVPVHISKSQDETYSVEDNFSGGGKDHTDIGGELGTEAFVPVHISKYQDETYSVEDNFSGGERVVHVGGGKDHADIRGELGTEAYVPVHVREPHDETYFVENNFSVRVECRAVRVAPCECRDVLVRVGKLWSTAPVASVSRASAVSACVCEAVAVHVRVREWSTSAVRAPVCTLFQPASQCFGNIVVVARAR